MTTVDRAAPMFANAAVNNAGSRRRRDRIAKVVLFLAVLLAVIPLALIFVVTIANGIGSLNIEFLTTTQPLSFRQEGGGFLHGLVGTAMMVGIAILISVPLGIATAVFVTEYPDSFLTRPVRFFTDVMTGVPSIFVGLFVYAALVREVGLGFGTLPGAIAIAILMLPIVVRSAEEILRLVPADIRNASTALGARRWQTTLFVVLPAASSGLITGVMLAVARGAGETAPLILTAFGTAYLTTSLVGEAQTALPLLIFEGARLPFEAAQQRAWAGALELVALVLLLTVAARLISGRNRARGH